MVVRLTLIVALGVALYLIIDLLLSAALGSLPSSGWQTSSWWALLYGPLTAAQQVLPALAVGYMAKRQGLLLGAVAAGASWAVAAVVFHDLSFKASNAPFFLSRVLQAATIGAVSGLAGQFIRVTPSNNSFKPKPLRGSA
jgi:hypothetical protein